MTSVSFEALRLTSHAPSEIYRIMGPNAVDGLIRQSLTTCWNSLAAETRSLEMWEKFVRDVYGRNMHAWEKIKQPSPANFFVDLRPEAADGYMRQGMILCFMMLPRGKRSLAAVRQAVSGIFERNLAAWNDDHHTFTKGAAAKKKPAAAPKKKAKVVKKKAARRR